MTVRVLHRPARLEVPAGPSGPQPLAPPPTVDEGQASGQGMVAVMMPVLAGTGSLTVVLTNLNRPLFAALGLVFFAGAVSLGILMFATQRRGPRKRVRAQRQRYVQYLDQVRAQVRAAERGQRTASIWRHPASEQLASVVVNPARRWERRRGDADFLTLRIGVGDVPSSMPLMLDLGDNPLTAYDPTCLTEARQLVADRALVPDLAVVVPLQEQGVMTVLGAPAVCRDSARALLAQAVVWHAPDDLTVLVVRAPAVTAHWEWVKWLPHVEATGLQWRERPADLPEPAAGRLVFDSVAEAQELLGPQLAYRVTEVRRAKRRYPAALLVLVDGEHLPPHAGITCPDQVVELVDVNVHVVYLLSDRRTEPETVDVRLELPDSPSAVTRLSDSAARLTGADSLTAAQAVLVARLLAPVRLAPDLSDGPQHVLEVDWRRMLAVSDPAAVDVSRTWAQRPDAEVLRVPIGGGDDGRLVHLDLKESARGGMGPHGLIVGATGSGKSELLRTLVTSLAVTHHPDELAMVLVDYKGGATFAGLAGLPHCAGMLTNLADDMSLVDRMREALYGEIQRRQELFKTAGSVPNLLAYRRTRAAAVGAGEDMLPPVPNLLIVIDEFAELLSDRPDFAELFVAIGRIGRSIGLHLLLATQRLELGKIRGLETHLSYRIALRTFSDSESREAIGTPDAYRLPPEPGLGYLKVDTSVYRRFHAAYVSSPYAPPGGDGPDRKVAPVRLFTTAEPAPDTMFAPPPTEPAAPPPVDKAGARPTVLDVTVARLADGAGALAQLRGTPVQVHEVCLDPLPAMLPLRRVVPPVDVARVAAGKAAGPVAVLGLLDSPRAQRQDPFVFDLAGPGANLLVVGGPQSGKSMLVRTLVLSASYLQTPRKVAFYLIDAGGGALRGLTDLPHVGVVASRAEPELLRRTVNEVLIAVGRRERAFNAASLDSAAQWRAWRGEGNTLAGDTPTGGEDGQDLGDIYLVVDGWGALRDDFEDLDDLLAEIASSGPAYGVHVVLTVTSPLQMRHRMLPSFAGRLELRLTDPFDSAFGRVLAETVPADIAGRGLSGAGQVFQTALPRFDDAASVKDLAAAQQSMVRWLADAWGDRPRVPGVRTLPIEVPLSRMPGTDPAGVAFGLSEADLGPARLQLFGGDPHLLVFGDSETGKTNTLRVLAEQLMRGRPPQQLGIVLVDYRRTLLEAVPDEYRMAYCTTRQTTEATIAELAAQLTLRLPPPDVTATQLRARSWWSGPEMVVIVDDYDLVTTSAGNPLLPLVELLAQARDVGLHLIVARRAGGAGRALFDPLLQRLTDLATPGLLHSGARGEGPLACGVPAARLPTGRVVWARRIHNPTQVQIAVHPGDA